VQRFGVRRLTLLFVVLLANELQKGMIVIHHLAFLGYRPLVLLFALEQTFDFHIFVRVVFGGMDS
jgi:hypothetical protein